MSNEIALSAPDARTLTDRIKTGAAVLWDLLKQAYVGDAWRVLGYESWDSYCTSEFGTSRIVMPREERAVEIPSMRELGMPIRAIASATNLSFGTVQAITSGDQKRSPESLTEVKGLDGKTYSASQPERPRATAIPQDELDALNTPPESEDDTPPQWEHVAQLPTAAVEQMKQNHQPIRVPEEDETEKDRLVELMSCIRKAERALKDAVYIAQRIEVWDGQKIGGDLHELIDTIDTTLTTGGLDGELARLIEGNQS